jgi:plasmid segregation protein ParM
MSFAGIDIGYGYTKVVYDGGQFIFKTTVEPYIHSEKVFGKSPDVVYVNGNGYLVGPDALPRMQVTKDFVGSESYYAIIGYCLNEIYRKTDSVLSGIALGLPPSLYNERKTIFLRNNLEKADLLLNKTPIIIPEKIAFVPQGVGAYIDFVYQNPDYTDKDVIVIDIGYYTVDMIFIKEGKFIPRASESYPSGMELLLNRICNDFSEKHGDFITPVLAESILKKGSFTYFGKEYEFDSQHVLEKFYIPELARRIKEYSITLKNNYFEVDSISTIVITGGGAVYIKDMIDGAFIPDEPQFANARGYKIYLQQL